MSASLIGPDLDLAMRQTQEERLESRRQSRDATVMKLHKNALAVWRKLHSRRNIGLVGIALIHTGGGGVFKWTNDWLLTVTNAVIKHAVIHTTASY